MASVLIVDDEEDVAEAYAAMLGDEFSVRTAYGAQDALQQYDQEIDVVLLDRRMPGMSGDQVLKAIRDREGKSQIAMVTAVNPDFDVIDMGFDDYVVKPIDGPGLKDTVRALLNRLNYRKGIQDYFALVSTKVTLEAEHHERLLKESDEYTALLDEIDQIEANLGEIVDDFSGEDYSRVLRRFDPGQDKP